ncbi:hypothetical protein ACFL3I_07135 [Pseudomonadota bacterium]
MEFNHVGYGDGVYKSLDGGNSWKHMGLKVRFSDDSTIPSRAEPVPLSITGRTPGWQ